MDVQVKVLIGWVACKIQGRGLDQKYKVESQQSVLGTRGPGLGEVTRKSGWVRREQVED